METTTAAVGHEPAEESGGLFSIDPGLVIWTWVVFGLLLIILRKFAWKPMMESVEKREQLMAQAVEQAQKTREELDRIAQKQAEIIREAQNEARKIISDGRVAAEATARRIDEEAQAHARKTIDSAREQLNQEKELALREIRQQSVDLIISASEQLIGGSLNDEEHRRIVAKHLEEW